MKKLSKDEVQKCTKSCVNKDAKGRCPCAVPEGGHTVVCTGWGVSKGGIKYWVLRNSWGPDAHVGGFIHFLRGENLHGIEEDAYFAAGVKPGGFLAGAKLGELSDCLEVGNAVDNDEILQDESNFLEGQQLMQNYKNPDLNRCFVRNTCDKWLEVVFNQGSTPFVNQEEHTGGCVGKLPRAHNKYLVPPSSKLDKQKNMFNRDVVPYLFVKRPDDKATHKPFPLSNCNVQSEKEASLSDWQAQGAAMRYQYLGPFTAQTVS